MVFVDLERPYNGMHQLHDPVGIAKGAVQMWLEVIFCIDDVTERSVVNHIHRSQGVPIGTARD
ncbi:Uncharacterised protein [Mycobacteroides abscessus subsp. abscessus]|nr:Uncharacterised protein [Mycobacteroides abscessus subsp. abscessus]